VGQEINANHIRPVRSGLVTGTARPIHLGSRSQVWGIEMRDAQDRLTCISRLTIAVVDRTSMEPRP
jgi:1,4-dihydroxy-2-naphthoyl-CoA hydrolase